MSSEVAQEVFSHIPDGWGCARLIDCTTDGNISYGIVQPGQHSDDGIPIIRVNNVNNGQLELDDVLKVAPEIEEKYKRTRLIGGEVLLTLVGSTGQSFVAPSQLAGWNVPRAIAVIRPKVEIGADWINICLQSKPVQHFLDVRANTTVQKTLNLKDVRDIPIPLPPEGIKEKIESIAVSLQGKIELNRQINQTLEHIAQAIFKSWFVDFEPVKAKIHAKQNGHDPERAAMCAISGKTDTELDTWLQTCTPEERQQLTTTAALFPDELEDSELGPIPKGWEVRKIEEVINRFPVGKKFSQKTASEAGAVPILDQGKSGIIGFHDEKPGVKASPEDPIIVFANHTCYMRLIMHDFSAIQNVLPFKGGDINVYWIFMATYGKQEFIEYKGHWPDFVIQQITIPNSDLDVAYGNLVADHFKMIFLREKENESLSLIRDALLPKLLSGEIDLTESQAKAEAIA